MDAIILLHSVLSSTNKLKAHVRKCDKRLRHDEKRLKHFLCRKNKLYALQVCFRIF